MHNPYYKCMMQIFGIIYYLQCDITPKTLPLVIFKFLNATIFLYGEKKIVSGSF